MFHIGQEVVCVYDAHCEGIVKGNHYIIEGFETEPLRPDLGSIFVILEGVALGLMYRGYFPHRFRPIIRRQTDISVFQSILRNTKAPEHV